MKRYVVTRTDPITKVKQYLIRGDDHSFSLSTEECDALLFRNRIRAKRYLDGCCKFVNNYINPKYISRELFKFDGTKYVLADLIRIEEVEIDPFSRVDRDPINPPNRVF